MIEVQRICAKCEVIRECREYRKRTNTTDGIWAASVYRLGTAKG